MYVPMATPAPFSLQFFYGIVLHYASAANFTHQLEKAEKIWVTATLRVCSRACTT